MDNALIDNPDSGHCYKSKQRECHFFGYFSSGGFFKITCQNLFWIVEPLHHVDHELDREHLGSLRKRDTDPD